MSDNISEMIGRSDFNHTSINYYHRTYMPIRPTVDRTRADYEFWGKLRRGKADGYRLGGLFAPAIGRIQASWVLGDGFDAVTGDEYTDEQLKTFIEDNLHNLNEWLYDAYTLGDGVLAVNPDTSLTLITPNQLDIETNPLDWRKVDAYGITSIIDQSVNFVRDMVKPDFQERLTNGASGVTIYDYYTRETRTVKIEKGGVPAATKDYPNLIDRLPIVHYPNARETNEVTGHPVYEHLLYLFARYDNAINKSLDGIEIMGNPLLVAEGLKDPNASKRANATSTQTVKLKDGTTREESVTDVSMVQMWWLGEGGSLNFKSPPPFTGDSARMLELLFYLMLQSSLIPEWTWGGAISSSKASVDAQTPAFVRSVMGWRSALKTYLLDICQLFLAYKSLVDPRIKADLPITLTFSELIPKDALIMLKKIELAAKEGLLAKVDELRLLDLVENPQEAVDMANEEGREAQEQFERQTNDAINASLEAEEEPEIEVSPNGKRS